MSRDVFMKVGGHYNATSYWTERDQIAAFMKLKLNEELQRAYATCEGLQVLRIDLPKSFEDSIVSTQVEVQKISMRKFEQQAELIRQDINVIISEAQQEIKVTNATALAEAYKLKQYAKAKATELTIDTETEIYKQVKNKIGLKDQAFNDYIYYTNLQNQKDAHVLVGLQSSIVNMGKNNNNLH
jgi:regulator of protease activity HflC (stomatin/prohibitin superfamily)